MTESKVKKDNFVVIQGWMLSELNLKGNELVVYACIYGFSQIEEQWFTGSRQYLAEWTNSTKRGIQKCLNSLVDKGLLVKREKNVNGVKFCEYQAVRTPLENKVPVGGEQSSLPSEQSSLGGGEQSSHNNIDIHNIDNKIENSISSPTPYKQIEDMYHSICISYPKLKTMSQKRKDAIKARFKTYGLEGFKILFEKAEASSFLKGFGGNGWRATFDWLIKDDNMAKVLEGNYDDKKPQPVQNKTGSSTSKYGDLSHLLG